jgi:predicted dehydrogenase
MNSRNNAGNPTSRRTFLKTVGAGAAAVTSTKAMGNVLGANDRIGVGMIGCGGRGRDHLKILAGLKEKGINIEIVAVCDTYRPRLDKAAKAHSARAYMDHREMIADKNVHVVGIATPDHIHGYQVIDAIEAKKDVYCEKPVTHWRQFELTKRMVKVVEASDRIFQIGTQGLSDSAWHQARKLVERGLIGQPIHAECGYFRVGDWGERGMPIDDPNARPGPDLNWEAFLGDAPKRPFDVSRYFRWRMYEDYSGGPGTDLFPHSLTPVVYILDLDMPSIAVGTGGKFRYDEREVPDTFNMLVDYPNKVTVAVLGTQGNDYMGATGGRASVNRCPTIRGWDGTLTFEGQEIVFTPAWGSKTEKQRIKIEQGEDNARYWDNLFECCRSRKQPPGTMRLAYRVQTAVQMAMLAHRKQTMARFDAKNEQIVV